MAFFKFRFPGQAATDAASTEATVSVPNENIDIVRRRARHRLIGSVVLVLIAVVGFPLLFDTQPRPVAVDTPIVIPDRQSVAPLTTAPAAPAAQAPAKPLLPDAKPLPAQAGLDAREEVVLPSAPVVAVKPTEPKIAEPKAAPVKPAEVKPAETKPAPAKVTKPEPAAPAKPKDDGSKAKSLLDGKSGASSAERHVIQVGAFADAAKVREVRKKLEQAGLTTYTQTIDGKDGKPTTRVRVGPFDSREEADKAAGRIRKLELSPVVLRI